MAKTGDYLIPWKDGSIVHWANPNEQYDWKPNDEFWAALAVMDHVRGMSASYVTLVDMQSPSRKHPMFCSDLVDMVQRVTMKEGEIIGYWKVKKRGRNYGLTFIREDDSKELIAAWKRAGSLPGKATT